MPRVSLLYIDDEIVGPHLKLLRQVCEPASTSKPHVTVRFFDRLGVPPEYVGRKVTHIDLVGPDTFANQPNGNGIGHGTEKFTVFIRCKSDDLTPLEHKPDFPGSDFHITVYDGTSRTFSRRLLSELHRFKWRIRVPLPQNTALTLKEVKAAGRSRDSQPRPYPTELRQLFWRITALDLDREFLRSLRDAERLKLCRAVLKSLFVETREFERVRYRRRSPSRAAKEPFEPELPEVHLTPPELAREIAEYAVSQLPAPLKPIHFGDPAVGTGAFFAALLQTVSRGRVATAIGVDVNSEQVEAARWRWSYKGMQVYKGDYLHMERLPPRTLILANPPYLRHQSIPARYKARLRERASVRTDIRVSAQSGLYVYFLLLAHPWMNDDAIAAWLIPGEFMRASYGKAVRQYLVEKVELIRLHEFGRDVPQFEKVKVSPVLIVLRNRKPSKNHEALLTAGGTLSAPAIVQHANNATLRVADSWSIPFVAATPGEVAHLRLGDLFTVRRGIATGANEFFLMTRAQAHERGIPEMALKPVLPKVRALGGNIIESEPDGYPKVQPQLCVIDCDLPLDAIRKRFPRFMKYLETAKASGILERHLLKDRNPWYRQEQRRPPRFLCTYMGRGTNGEPPLHFVWNKSKGIATNTYLLLYPKPDLEKAIERDPSLEHKLFLVLQDASKSVLREKSRIHAGGLHKIEPRDLAHVPLNAPRWLHDFRVGQMGLESWFEPTARVLP
jgi:hypothetical protein